MCSVLFEDDATSFKNQLNNLTVCPEQYSTSLIRNHRKSFGPQFSSENLAEAAPFRRPRPSSGAADVPHGADAAALGERLGWTMEGWRLNPQTIGKT